MKVLVKNVLIASVIGFMGFSLSATAQERRIKGVVVSKNEVKNTITVKSDVSGRRHSYFIDGSTKLLSQGKQIGFSEIKRGQKVSMAFRQTDSGRELITFRVPNPDEIIEIIPVEFDEELTISGIVTGIRANRRTITIRSEDRSETLTLHIPEGTRITRNGESVAIKKLIKGDRAAFRYNITEEGYIIVSGKSPKAAPTVVENVTAAVPMLPKTASNQFAWLFGAFGLLIVAGLVNLARRRSI